MWKFVTKNVMSDVNSELYAGSAKKYKKRDSTNCVTGDNVLTLSMKSYKKIQTGVKAEFQ